MKKLVLAASIATLASCSQGADESATDTASADATTAAVAGHETGNGLVGTYQVKMDDGTTATTTIGADGSFEDSMGDGTHIKGQYAHKDGKDCYDPAGEDPEMCWTVSDRAADGSFKATTNTPDGDFTVTMTPIDDTAKAAAGVS